MDRDSVKGWSQRLRDAQQQGGTGQARALLSAFAKIDDTVFREEIVILLEIIAANPVLLSRMKQSYRMLTEPLADVIQFRQVR
jgi:hypothetical protein